jgi:hypothetical protein
MSDARIVEKQKNNCDETTMVIEDPALHVFGFRLKK